MARPAKHNLARLRQMLGLTQEDLAELIDYSPAMVASVETTRTPMSEEMAKRVSLETGVSAHWLLENNLTAEPYTDEPSPRLGYGYSPELYHAIKAEKEGMLGGTAAASMFEANLIFFGQLANASLHDPRAARALYRVYAEITAARDAFHRYREGFETDGKFEFWAPEDEFDKFFLATMGMSFLEMVEKRKDVPRLQPLPGKKSPKKRKANARKK